MKRFIFLLVLIPTVVFGGELYNEQAVMLEGKVYSRMPSGKILNPLNGIPSLEMVTESAEVVTDKTTGKQKTRTEFVRRVSVNYMDFLGKRFPTYDANLNQTGYASGDALWSIMIGAWLLAEKKADGQVGIIPNSSPVTLCYVTSSTPECVLPENP